MRKPQIENKYNLTVKDIKNFKLVDLEKLKTVCWRNKIINAWCFQKNIENGESSVWVGFYDNGKIEINCSCYEDMCNYNFNNFFDYKKLKIYMT